jgi:hypothetical protein
MERMRLGIFESRRIWLTTEGGSSAFHARFNAATHGKVPSSG